MELQFSIKILLSVFTARWYVVTKGNSLSAVLCFCGFRDGGAGGAGGGL